MRIIVVGCSGAGKTALARQIASQLKLEHIEIDAITWQAGWRDLSRSDPDEYARRVTKAMEGEAWVADQPLPQHLRLRATHVVWLDYERPVVMARVIRRSVMRAVLRTKLWAGNRERLSDMLRSSGPILWAWRNWARRRRVTEEWLGRGGCAGLTVLRLRHPSEAATVLARLAAATDTKD
ncbi:MAG: adenylate kinase [Acetobacteraceae bacterium]|nr:adenylate kinase [Acetobacteraceae bacterium]